MVGYAAGYQDGVAEAMRQQARTLRVLQAAIRDRAQDDPAVLMVAPELLALVGTMAATCETTATAVSQIAADVPDPEDADRVRDIESAIVRPFVAPGEREAEQSDDGGGVPPAA